MRVDYCNNVSLLCKLCRYYSFEYSILCTKIKKQLSKQKEVFMIFLISTIIKYIPIPS